GKVAYSPDGRRLASASWDGKVKIWDAVTGECLRTLEGHMGRAWGVAFSPDGRHVASTSWDKTVKVGDTGTGECVLTLKGHTDKVWGVAYSPDERRLASTSTEVIVWDAISGQKLFPPLKGHKAQFWFNGVAFSPDGRCLASARWDGT